MKRPPRAPTMKRLRCEPAMERPPCALRVAVSVADVHREAGHESELVTQAILGDRLRVLAAADGGRWFRVRLADGYTGWIRSWLAAPDRRGWPGPRIVEIDEPLAWIRSRATSGSDPVSDVVIGTRLAGRPSGRSGWVRVTLPDGRSGFLPRSCLLGRAIRAVDRPRRPATAPAVLATARRFLGIPYVWGGRSPKGLDCSGLTQMTLALHGIAIPRDSRDQRAFLGRRGPAFRDPAAVPPGGLLFFGSSPGRTTHVGFSLGDGLLLHARGRVRLDSLCSSNELFDKELAGLFQVGHLPPLAG